MTVNGGVEAGPRSLGDYAKHAGVSKAAVSKAIRRGRLKASVTVVKGQPKILDFAAADVEWRAGRAKVPPAPPSPPPAPGVPSESAFVCRRGDRVAIAFLNSASPRTDHGVQDGSFLDAAQLETPSDPIDETDYSLANPLLIFTLMDRQTARELAAALLLKANE